MNKFLGNFMPKLVLCTIDREELVMNTSLVMKGLISKSLALMVSKDNTLIARAESRNDLTYLNDIELAIFKKVKPFECNGFFDFLNLYREEKLIDDEINKSLFKALLDFNDIDAIIQLDTDSEQYSYTTNPNLKLFEILLYGTYTNPNCLNEKSSVRFKCRDTFISFNLLKIIEVPKKELLAICSLVNLFDAAKMQLIISEELKDLGIVKIECPVSYSPSTLADILILDKEKGSKSFLGIPQVHLMDNGEPDEKPLKDYVLNLIKQQIYQAIIFKKGEVKGVRAAKKIWARTGISYEIINPHTGKKIDLKIPHRTHQILVQIENNAAPLEQIIKDVKDITESALSNPSIFRKKPTQDLYGTIHRYTTSFTKNTPFYVKGSKPIEQEIEEFEIVGFDEQSDEDNNDSLIPNSFDSKKQS